MNVRNLIAVRSWTAGASVSIRDLRLFAIVAAGEFRLEDVAPVLHNRESPRNQPCLTWLPERNPFHNIFLFKPSILKLLNFYSFLKISLLLEEGSSYKFKFPISPLQPAKPRPRFMNSHDPENPALDLGNCTFGRR